MASDKRVIEFKRRIADLCVEYGMELAVSDSDHAHLRVVERKRKRRPSAILRAEDVITPYRAKPIDDAQLKWTMEEVAQCFNVTLHKKAKWTHGGC